jgi:hypothetical protein
MRGGYWDYEYRDVNDAVWDIEKLIETNHDKTLDQHGDLKGRHFSDEVLSRLREAVAVMRVAAVYWERIDYLLSFDDTEERFLRRLAKELADAGQSDQMSVLVHPIQSLRKTGSDEASPRLADDATRADQVLALIESLPDADKHIMRDVGSDQFGDEPGWRVTTEWLVGAFAGRSFPAGTRREAATDLIDYLDQHIGHDSIVGVEVTASGWPDLAKVRAYCLQEWQAAQARTSRLTKEETHG